MYPTDLTDEQWELLKPFVVKPIRQGKGRGRKPKQDYRNEINGMLYVAKTGCQWRMLPKEYPKWGSVYGYFRQWRLQGTWDAILHALRKQVRSKRKEKREPDGSDSGFAIGEECGERQ